MKNADERFFEVKKSVLSSRKQGKREIANTLFIVMIFFFESMRM